MLLKITEMKTRFAVLVIVPSKLSRPDRLWLISRDSVITSNWIMQLTSFDFSMHICE